MYIIRVVWRCRVGEVNISRAVWDLGKGVYITQCVVLGFRVGTFYSCCTGMPGWEVYIISLGVVYTLASTSTED